ncbi:MAG: peptidoglycan-binding protein [Candidatus Eisenbacteria bacterium]|uniref:Peptidoglycan-binding protein n=1 Tax=Eiseniibacteriota bacterium TaxID=2212470 RepID=A0A956SFN6_UNCEI|nr:peptidoglycan-binding protein [Candidatus Eisenbacteria bacterium]MCB9464194.1 peptidoglycan-binding protein [Candidatus Eisenbacteria bacterium]
MKGKLVKTVQRALRNEGYSPGPIDGIYGPQTAAAVRSFQLWAGLAVDGEVGPLTAEELGVEWY